MPKQNKTNCELRKKLASLVDKIFHNDTMLVLAIAGLFIYLANLIYPDIRPKQLKIETWMSFFAVLVFLELYLIRDKTLSEISTQRKAIEEINKLIKVYFDIEIFRLGEGARSRWEKGDLPSVSSV